MPNDDGHTRKNIAHQTIGAAIDLSRGDYFITGLQNGEKRTRNGSHTRCGDDGRFRAFQRGQLLLSDSKRWVSVTRVNVSRTFTLGPALHFLRIGKREIRGADNLHAHGGADAEFFLARVDREGGIARAFRVLSHFFHDAAGWLSL